MKVDHRQLNYSILIVEDNAVNIKYLTLCLLEMKNIIITVATTGKKALKIFNPFFDIILLDIGLPDIEGLEVCKKIRELPDGKKVPIIACSAHSTLHKEDFKSAGLNDFLAKPFNIYELQKIINHWLLIIK